MSNGSRQRGGALETRSPVKLRAVENDRHYRGMVAFMNRLVDKIGDDENHPLMGLLDVVTFFIRDYEERHGDIPDAQPAAVLRFLMHQHAQDHDHRIDRDRGAHWHCGVGSAMA